MIAIRLVRLIESHCDELSENLVEKLLADSRTSDLRNIPVNELRGRIHELLQHLSEWLLTKTTGDIESKYVALGTRRLHKACLCPTSHGHSCAPKNTFGPFCSARGFC